MKRTIALLLTLLLALGAAMPTVLAERTAQTQSAASAAQSAAGETAAPAVQTSAPESQASAPAAQSPAPAAPDLALSARSVQSAAPANTAAALHFEDLRAVLTQYNSNIRALSAALADVSHADTDALEKAVSGLQALRRGVSAALADAQTGVQISAPPEGGETPAPDTNLVRLYTGLTISLTTCGGLLDAQITSLQSQIDSFDTTVETTQNTLNNAINQIVRGAETLYAAILTMEAAVGGVDRGIAALERAAAITEKRQELGMASAYETESLRHQLAQARSGRESLLFQIKTSKVSLESLCGMELRGTVSLSPLAMPTAEELAAVSYEQNVSRAAARNVDVLNADAKRYGDDTDHDANRKAYDAAVDAFSAKYLTVCLTVPEKARLVQAAQETADFQQRTFSIAEKKYALGMLSREEYLAAQSSLDAAGDDLAGAQRDLFSAYRSYVWATQYGIV
jgi:outer membrane protein TolC